MSTGMFEGLEPRPADNQSYAPGRQREAHPFVRELVEEYLGKGEYWLACRRCILGITLASLIEPTLAEWPDHNAFLDDAARSASENTLTRDDERGSAILLT